MSYSDYEPRIKSLREIVELTAKPGEILSPEKMEERMSSEGSIGNSVAKGLPESRVLTRDLIVNALTDGPESQKARRLSAALSVVFNIPYPHNR